VQISVFRPQASRVQSSAAVRESYEDINSIALQAKAMWAVVGTDHGNLSFKGTSMFELVLQKCFEKNTL
jgi:hypothetical protein